VSDDTETIGDEGQTPQQWADQKAAEAGAIWAARYPGSNKDW
jgi:hypothetical protein